MKTNALFALASLVSSINAVPQGGGAIEYKRTYELKGDGSPRQAYLYEQVTPNAHCGANTESCSMSRTEVETSTISWTLSADGGPLAGWISGGFSVSESTSQGFTANCNAGIGDSTASVVCVWARIAHTGYEVDAWEHLAVLEPSSGTKLSDDAGWFWSPNSGNVGHDYVCAHDDECWGMGEDWWGHKSKGDALEAEDTNKGGPHPYVWGTDHADRWN